MCNLNPYQDENVKVTVLPEPAVLKTAAIFWEAVLPLVEEKIILYSEPTVEGETFPLLLFIVIEPEEEE